MIYPTEEEALTTLRLLRRLPAQPRSFKWGESNGWHRVLLADGEPYCGDFTCHGECGLPKLIRIVPLHPELDGFHIEQASALMGMEPVWSNFRWEQSQPWRGEVILAPYDPGNNPWWG